MSCPDRRALLILGGAGAVLVIFLYFELTAGSKVQLANASAMVDEIGPILLKISRKRLARGQRERLAGESNGVGARWLTNAINCQSIALVACGVSSNNRLIEAIPSISKPVTDYERDRTRKPVAGEDDLVSEKNINESLAVVVLRNYFGHWSVMPHVAACVGVVNTEPERGADRTIGIRLAYASSVINRNKLVCKIADYGDGTAALDDE